MEKIFSNKVTSVLIALLVCAFWGSLFPFVKIGYEVFWIQENDIPSIVVFAGLRFLVSSIILILINSIKSKKPELPMKDGWRFVLMSALTSIILHYSFTYVALSLGEGSKSAIIKQVGFLFLSCFAFLFDKEDHFSMEKLLAGILGFAGIIVTNMDGTGFRFSVGDFLLILASVCSVTSIVVSKKGLKKVSPVNMVAYSQLIGGVVLCIVGLAMGGRIVHVEFKAIAVFGYICFASIAAYTMWNTLLKYNHLSKLSVIKFTEPLFAVIFSGMLLGENIFKISYLVAMIIILAAILLANKKKGER